MVSGTGDAVVQYIRSELEKARPGPRRRAIEKFTLAAISAIPWVGGFISAAVAMKLEDGQIRTDSLQALWLAEHAEKMARLEEVLLDTQDRFEEIGESIDERIESSEYLDIVRKAFRTWDQSDTDEKRRYVANLIANAAGTRVTSDDVVRLFISWLDSYHEAHLAVIAQIYQHPGITRKDIWARIHGPFPRDDSAEADLFRMLIRDLSTGGVIRQPRQSTPDGHWERQSRPQNNGAVRSNVVESAFESTKPYVLTALGEQFVHYTMTELVPRLAAPA